ncbi:MAG TPA: tetratricopeptide repeat protein [Methanothrix sp.]|nr:tetratricopeptide repeat protein [Methanothrix sp.]HQI68707.1 tetratricopeptide repeat protein [Methanothrix sp.]HRS85668.1 tetratricopeptide repeat protein [Methanothrix sp.]
MKTVFSIALLALAVLFLNGVAQKDTADDWYKKGRELARNGSYEEAVFAYNRAIDLEPDNATFYTAIVPSLNMLAFITNNQSKLNESAEAIDKALAIDPKNPIAWEQKGSMLYQMQRYNESLEAYDRAIENIGSYRQDGQLNQTDLLSFTWTSKSISLWQLMRYNESLEAVDKAVQIAPAGNYDAWAFKGELLASLGRYNDSLQAFEGAAATEEASIQPEIRALPWSKEGYVLMQMGRYEEADRIYQNIIGLNFTSEGADRWLADAWRGRGNALAKLGDYNESIEAFDKAIELSAERAPYAWTEKGDALLASGRYDEAIKSYDRALELFPENADAGIARAYKGRGDALARAGRGDDALAAYSAAVKAMDGAISAFDNATPLDRAISFTFDPYPLDQNFWTDGGSVLSVIGEKEEAIQAYERALEMTNRSILQNPPYFNAYDAKGKILFELGRYNESIQVYDQFIMTDPGPRPSAAALVWKGRLLFEMGRANDSLDCLNQAVKLDPQSAEAWHWKAGISAELGRYEEALAAYDEALRLGGLEENAEIWQERGAALMALGRQAEADAAFEKAKELGYQG